MPNRNKKCIIHKSDLIFLTFFSWAPHLRMGNYEHILDKLVEVLERPDLLVAVAATKLSGSAQMTKQIPIALAACIATLSAIGMPTAQAKQLCSAAMPSDPHGRWWSYRLIDGRKCWYEGKPMLSKSLLEWPKEASAQPVSNGEVANVLTDKPSSPLDSQATAATPVPAPEQKANNTDRSGHAETVLRGDAEKTAAASPNNTDHLVAL